VDQRCTQHGHGWSVDGASEIACRHGKHVVGLAVRGRGKNTSHPANERYRPHVFQHNELVLVVQKRKSMSTKVNISEVIDAIDLATEEGSSYIHKSTGRVVTIWNEDIRISERCKDDLSDVPEYNKLGVAQVLEVHGSSGWLRLPSEFEVHEWELMDDFVSTLAEPRDREELADAIRGRGAFRAFRGAIRRLGLEDAWTAHRVSAIDDIAREWLEEHGFEPATQPQ
jgi:Uncharacterised protein family (UPF0158)